MKGRRGEKRSYQVTACRAKLYEGEMLVKWVTRWLEGVKIEWNVDRVPWKLLCSLLSVVYPSFAWWANFLFLCTPSSICGILWNSIAFAFAFVLQSYQASSNQQELETVLKQAEALRSRNESMSLELSTSRSAARQLRDELAERAEENVDTLNQVRAVDFSVLSILSSIFSTLLFPLFSYQSQQSFISSLVHLDCHNLTLQFLTICSMNNQADGFSEKAIESSECYKLFIIFI